MSAGEETTGGAVFEREYSRIPEDLWTDRRFTKMSVRGQLLFLHVASGPYRRPRSSGFLSNVSDSTIADSLGWKAATVAKARKEAETSGLLFYDPVGRSWFIRDLYFPVTNRKWWIGRLRELGTAKPCPLRTKILNDELLRKQETEKSQSEGIPKTWGELEKDFLKSFEEAIHKQTGILTDQDMPTDQVLVLAQGRALERAQGDGSPRPARSLPPTSLQDGRSLALPQEAEPGEEPPPETVEQKDAHFAGIFDSVMSAAESLKSQEPPDPRFLAAIEILRAGGKLAAAKAIESAPCRFVNGSIIVDFSQAQSAGLFLMDQANREAVERAFGREGLKLELIFD